MSLSHFVCGPFVTESERRTARYLQEKVKTPTEQSWSLFYNVSLSYTAPTHDIDLLVVGPVGLFLVEIKHWDLAYLKWNPGLIEREMERLSLRAKIISERLPQGTPLVCKLLLTKGENEKYKDAEPLAQLHGILPFGLSEWLGLLGLEQPLCLSSEEQERLALVFMPPTETKQSSQLQRLAEFIELQLVAESSTLLHRVFFARHGSSRDKVILHLYDLSASKEKNVLKLVEREFQGLQRLQTIRCLPNISASLQEISTYPGELYFFSFVGTEAPTLAARSLDSAWTLAYRAQAASRCLRALQELHQGEVLHRNLTPSTIHLLSSGEPVLAQLRNPRLLGVEPAQDDVRGSLSYLAPEVLAAGFEASTTASDLYSMCASLLTLFNAEPEAAPFIALLSGGIAPEPQGRPALTHLLSEIEKLSPTSMIPEAPLGSLYWDESTSKQLNGRTYRVVTRLSSSAFQVIEVDSGTGDEVSGPYVAKVFTDPLLGAHAVEAYAALKEHTNGTYTANISAVAQRWSPGDFAAVICWVKGTSLYQLCSPLPLTLAGLTAVAQEELLLRWVYHLCLGLSQLHQVGFVHGDISPTKIIIDDERATLTGYDLSVREGQRPLGGSLDYCAPSVEARHEVSGSDDIFALAASFFSVLYAAPPFAHKDGLDKTKGLAWGSLHNKTWPRLNSFLERATRPRPEERFSSAQKAAEFLNVLLAGKSQAKPEGLLFNNEVAWLSDLLQSYPASRRGNAETRGLDSAFALKTYVTTTLDQWMVQKVQTAELSLVLLCGNAGDGKTAFLQHLARNLGLEVGNSENRLWDYTLPNGVRLRANLDGSAAYRGKPANTLLNEFFAPFQKKSFPQRLVHLIAINDGPLLAWLDQMDDTYLKRQLTLLLEQGEEQEPDPRICFIDLNTRSLVGGDSQDTSLDTQSFLAQLIERLLGDNGTWEPCLTCTAQSRCHAFESVQALKDPARGAIIRRRLARAFQAVHQRGEVHITARSLRAAVSYIFFGLEHCVDLHADPTLRPPSYYDRAFDPRTEGRQGELLTELQWLDPALESNPRLDRFLLQLLAPEKSAGRSATALQSLRRRAYFELPEEKIVALGGHVGALDIVHGQYLSSFRSISTCSDKERAEITRDLCRGIARLEDLPDEAFGQDADVPLRITPRTPTETIFWIKKPLKHFSLQAQGSRSIEGIETLHTQVILSYRFENGHEERLLLGAELFSLLLEIKEGYQISDARSDDIFANLSIFKQRLMQESERQVFAWNPLSSKVFEVSALMVNELQKIRISEAK